VWEGAGRQGGAVAFPGARRSGSRGVRGEGSHAEFAEYTEVFGEIAEDGVTRRRGDAERVPGPGLRSSWSRTFLARINVHDEYGLFRRDLRSFRREALPGETGLTPRTLPTANQTPRRWPPAHATKRPPLAMS